MAFLGGRRNCWEECVYQVCEKFQLPFASLLWDCAAFRYDACLPDASVGERLSVNGRGILAALEHQHGVRYKVDFAIDISSWKSIVSAALTADSVVVVFVDAFFWPLDEGLGRYHHAHFVIIRSITASSVVVDDPFNGRFEYTIPILSLEYAVGSIHTFFREREANASCGSGSAQNPQSWQRPDLVATQLEHFTSEALRISPRNELLGYEGLWWACPLVNKIKRMISARRACVGPETALPLLRASVGHWDRAIVLLGLLLQGQTHRLNVLEAHLKRIAVDECELARTIYESRPKVESKAHVEDFVEIGLDSVTDMKSFGTLANYIGKESRYLWLGEGVSHFDLIGECAVSRIYQGRFDSVTAPTKELPVSGLVSEISLLYADMATGNGELAFLLPDLRRGDMPVGCTLKRARVLAEPFILYRRNGSVERTTLPGQIIQTVFSVDPPGIVSGIKLKATPSTRLIKATYR